MSEKRTQRHHDRIAKRAREKPAMILRRACCSAKTWEGHANYRMAMSLLILVVLTSVGPSNGGLLGKSSTVTLNKCIDVINTLNEATSQGNSNACLDCDPTLGVCPAGCQSLIGALWENCNGVTLPDGMYFDPNQELSGTWSKQTEAVLTENARRCGCSPASRLAAGASALVVLGLPLGLLAWLVL